MEHIPAEIIAKARAFRRRIEGADAVWLDMDDALHMELLQRVRSGKASYRPENGIDLARRRREAAATQFGQRPIAEWTGTRKLFRLREARLSTSQSRAAGWSEDALEDSINLVEITTSLDFRATEGEPCLQKFCTLASFGHHALVRYFQRAFRPSDDALANACWAILKTGIEETDRGVAIPIEAAGGRWFGRRVRVFDVSSEEMAQIGTTRSEISQEMWDKAGSCFSMRTFYSSDA